MTTDELRNELARAKGELAAAETRTLGLIQALDLEDELTDGDVRTLLEDLELRIDELADDE